MIATLALLLLSQEPPKAETKKSDLVLTASVDKAKYALPEEMQVEVKLENTADKDAEINELTYEESSVTFRVKAEWAGGQTKEYDLAVIRPDAHVSGRLAPVRVTLGAKKSLTLLRRFPTLAPGKFEITAKFKSGTGDVASAPVQYEVEGTAAGNKLVATVTTSQQGSFTIDLLPREAPGNVSNFVELVRRGFYNDMIFHRVINKQWVQTGCPYGTGLGGPGYALKAETEQGVKHEEGSVSMSGFEKAGHCGSQFFICLGLLPALDKKFTIVGRVPTDQLEAVKAVGRADVDKNTDRPRADVKVTNITIGTKN
jgi:cyclophilin family peptidyl-prolyl cis-trans isomerase